MAFDYITNHCIIFLQNSQLWKENSRLKELNAAHLNALRQRDEKIAELEKQLMGRKKPPINIPCHRQVRHVTKSLRKDGHEFDLNSNIQAPHNQQHLQRIVKNAQASREKFPVAEVIEAAKIHFNSLKAERIREEHGFKSKHRKGSRNGARKFKKLQHRLHGLRSDKCPLSADDQEKAQLIMKRDYMSSDEDELETNENGQRCRRVRHLPWMSDLANHYKNVCQDVYEKHVLLKRDVKKYQPLIRDENCAISDRRVPKDIPSWAVNL